MINRKGGLNLSILVLMSLLLVLAFSGIAEAGTLVNDTVAGRTFLYYIPDSYNDTGPAPIVFSFHGLGSNKMEQMLLSGFNEIADNEGFIVVYPQGRIISSPAWRGWNINHVGDNQFPIDIINRLSGKYNIDLNRIYATGMSNGGLMAYNLAIKHPDRFAAVASVTGFMPVYHLANLTPKRPITVLIMNGTADTLVPFDGGSIAGFAMVGQPVSNPMVPILSTSGIVNYFRSVNGITADPEVTYLPQTAPGDLTKIRREIHSGGIYRTRVILYQIIGGGHTWPGRGGIGTVSRHINGSEAIWHHLQNERLLEARITPRTINLASRGNSVKVRIQMPGILAAVKSVELSFGGLKVQADNISMDVNGNIKARVNWAELAEILSTANGNINIRIDVKAGPHRFTGFDRIRVIPRR